MECTLLVLLEVVGLEMLLIGFIGGIDFKDANLCGVLGTLHRVEADDARLALYTQAIYFVSKFEIFLEVLRIDLNLSNADLRIDLNLSNADNQRPSFLAPPLYGGE